MSLALKVVGGVAAVAAVVGIAHVAMAASEPDTIPQTLRVQIAKALAGADPDQMRALATSLRQQGYSAQATSLENAAAEVEQGIKAAGGKALPAPRKSGSPAKPAQRSLAGKVALAYTGATKYKEGAEAQNLLKVFQQEEKTRGFYQGNIDGLYGAKSALALAFDHGIVPPTPLYWPKKDEAGAKRAYAAKLLTKVQKDPQRAEEWQAAARV